MTKETTARLKSMPKLKQELISFLFNFVSRKRRNQWYKFKGEFGYDGTSYILEAEVKMDNQMFTYKNLLIEHKQKVIDIGELEFDANGEMISLDEKIMRGMKQ